MTLLEGRDACEFKLQAPLKFWTGRSDCVSQDADGHGYKVKCVSNFIARKIYIGSLVFSFSR